MVSRRTVRWASIRSIAAAARRLASTSATARRSCSTQQLGLEPEIDRARRDVEGQLLWLEVVFEKCHRERQRDPGAQAARPAGQPAIDRGSGQRPTRGIQPVHPEQPQDRAFLADRRRRPRTRAPGTRQRVGPGDQAVDRTPVGGHRARRTDGGDDIGDLCWRRVGRSLREAGTKYGAVWRARRVRRRSRVPHASASGPVRA